jgi:hypothetical protein
MLDSDYTISVPYIDLISRYPTPLLTLTENAISRIVYTALNACLFSVVVLTQKLVGLNFNPEPKPVCIRVHVYVRVRTRVCVPPCALSPERPLACSHPHEQETNKKETRTKSCLESKSE